MYPPNANPAFILPDFSTVTHTTEFVSRSGATATDFHYAPVAGYPHPICTRIWHATGQCCFSGPKALWPVSLPLAPGAVRYEFVGGVGTLSKGGAAN